jgi:hypothetical protein
MKLNLSKKNITIITKTDSLASKFKRQENLLCQNGLKNTEWLKLMKEHVYLSTV